ncbi:endo-1,4-beta-xylanase D [Auriculariales sp. MPI-PUGE-AT-0066]|nr:endo-1,4-beta-xylanase D [Auriculariales sp. MPI-PUGE-AT-0066]
MFSAVFVLLFVVAGHVSAQDLTTSPSGNPIIDDWYADPEGIVYNGTFWIYPTTSKAWGEQVYLDGFSSTDMVHWTTHKNVAVKDDFSWARGAMWAPAAATRNGKYYLYFSANDIQNDDQLGGIGVGVADKPEGPFKDAIGKPLIGKYYNKASPIDQDVFIDDDGQAYIYWGGFGRANVALLNEDMISLGTHSDGSVAKEITPEGYTEGSQMFKRNGKYYFMWSEDVWTGPNYAVAYAIADSPLGPFQRLGRVIQQDSAVATGSGHNGVLNVPNTDIWYITYHRRPLGETNGDHRVTCYERMYFEADDTIRPVVMGVKDNFADGNMLGWKTYGGEWSVDTNKLIGSAGSESKAALNTNFEDQKYEALVTLTSQPTDDNSDAGLIFRAGNIAEGLDAYSGYYAGLSLKGYVILGRSGGGWQELNRYNMTIESGLTYHVRATAIGSDIKIEVGNFTVITAQDSTYPSGTNGVRVFQASAKFGKVSVEKV